MLKKLLITIFLISSILASENPTKINSVYLEFLGQGGVLSLNYDKIFMNSSMSFRAGIGLFGYQHLKYDIPLGLYYYLGKNKKFNVGIVNSVAYISKIKFSQSIWFGYKSYLNNKILFRTGIAYRYYNKKHRVLPGISFGISF